MDQITFLDQCSVYCIPSVSVLSTIFAESFSSILCRYIPLNMLFLSTPFLAIVIAWIVRAGVCSPSCGDPAVTDLFSKRTSRCVRCPHLLGKRFSLIELQKSARTSTRNFAARCSFLETQLFKISKMAPMAIGLNRRPKSCLLAVSLRAVQKMLL